MTQLVNTDKGPQVLGEEINFFADPRANTMSTIAHEYGHVAVRQLSPGTTCARLAQRGHRDSG
jgi:hypothetical protein